MDLEESPGFGTLDSGVTVTQCYGDGLTRRDVDLDFVLIRLYLTR